MKDTTIRVIGTTPLMTNNFTRMMLQSDKPKTRLAIPTPGEEALDGRYFDPDGNLALPTGAFRKCAWAGGKGRKIGRTGLPSILLGSLFPFDEMTTILHPEEKFRPLGPDEYEVDKRRAVPPRQGAVIRGRPKMWPWAADVHFEYDDEIIDVASIADVLAMGGRTVGVGSFRPEKGGTFGRFVVDGF